MIYHSKKLFCYTAITALLNLSLQPVYAGHFHPTTEQEDLTVTTSPSPRLSVSEDSLQEQIKASTSGYSWIPQFIQDLSSQVHTKAASLLGSEPTGSVDSLKEYLKEDFFDEIENFKAYTPTEHDLTHLQERVWKGEVSPYQYMKGLKELESFASKTLLKKVHKKFQRDLKSYPLFLNWNLQKELVSSMKSLNQATSSTEDFKDLFTYYRQVLNPLDYIESLVKFRQFIQKKQKDLNLTDKAYGSLNEKIIEAIRQRDGKAYATLKAERQQFMRHAQELPYNGEDLSVEDVFNSSLAPSDAKAKEEAKESLSFTAAIKGLTQGVYKGMRYALEHPGQAMTLGLAAQVTATAAWNTKRALGDEFIINQNTTGYQSSPSIIALSNDNAFVVWRSNQTENFDIYDIYGRVFSPNGTALSNEFPVNQNTTGNQFFSSVTGLSDGNAFVVWPSDQTGNSDIYGRLFSPNGTALSNEFTINQNTTSSQGSPSVTGLSDGNAFVVWNGDQTRNLDIYGRLFSPNGIALGNEFTINQITTSTQVRPSITGLSDGNAFVVWEGRQTGNSDIYGRLFSPNGTALSNEFPVNQNTTGDQYNLSVTGLSDGNAFVVWQGYQTGNSDIYGRLFSPNGVALSNEFPVNQNTTGDKYTPSVTGLSDGNAFVAWAGSQTGNDDIYGRLFSPNGTALSNEFTINQNTTGDQYVPSVTALSNDNAFVVWRSNQTGSSDIYGRIFNPSNPPLTTDAMTTAIPTTTAESTNVPTTGGVTTGTMTTELTPSSTTSSSHKLTPNWLLFPVKVISNAFESVYEYCQS